MSKKILNVYEFESENGKTYIYSLEKKEGELSFKYYLLKKNENLESNIYEAKNTLNILQLNNIKLIPVKKDSINYQKFLNELEQVIQKNEFNKEKAIHKK